jgi:hypothetical protein
MSLWIILNARLHMYYGYNKLMSDEVLWYGMGSHSVGTHWMYQYCGLYLTWWWPSEPKHVAEFLIFITDY